MKNIMISAILLASLFVACQSNSNKSVEQTATGNTEHEHRHDATHEHHDEAGITNGSKNGSVNELIAGYLKLKNALTKDNTNEAASAGKEMVVTIESIDVNALTTEQKKTFDEVMDDTKEHAEHIGSNKGNIEHQREHFGMLSKDVNDLIKTFGADQKLYQDFCPMYDEGKGAIWISETKDIKNPYYGNKMLSCGKMQKEL